MRNRVFITQFGVINSDSHKDCEKLIQSGATELSYDDIVALGMKGFENIVSPANTVIGDDGAITFTPPDPPSSASLFVSLRSDRDRRLAETDYMLMPDYPISDDQRTILQVYRQALRDLPSQEGAPWDGGGEATPWPLMPELANFRKAMTT